MPVPRQTVSDSDEPFARVSERPSAHPESFPDREGPTLASPNSGAISTQTSTEQRLVKALDRIQQLEADLKSLSAQVLRLGEAFDAERRRGKAARLGRYLLWGALIVAMATFWIMLRLRLGPR
jgi:molecular chaperone GrpE (heat shock protein)